MKTRKSPFLVENRILRWFWSDAIWPFRRDIIYINVLDLLATITEIGAYGVLIVCITKWQAPDTDIRWINHWIQSLSVTALLTWSTIMAVILFTANAGLKYAAKVTAIQLARKYDLFCVTRLVQEIHRAIQDTTPVIAYRVRKAIIKDSRISGGMLKNVASFPIPLLKIVGSFFYMLYLHAALTIVVILVIFVLLFFLRRLSARIVALTREKERLLPLSIRNILNQIHTPGYLHQTTADDVVFSIGDEHTQSFYEKHYQSRMLANQHALMIQLSIALMTGLMLAMAGSFMHFHSIDWATLVSYVIAMQLFFRNLHGAAGMARQSSIKFDYIAHYLYILQAARSGNLAVLTESDTGNVLSLDADDDEDAGNEDGMDDL